MNESAINAISTELGAHFKQDITCLILNGVFKGRTTSFTNIRSYSGVVDLNIRIGDELFVALDDHGDIVRLIEFKRDFYLTLVTILFVVSLLLFNKQKALRTIITLILNIFIFCAIIFSQIASASWTPSVE